MMTSIYFSLGSNTTEQFWFRNYTSRQWNEKQLQSTLELPHSGCMLPLHQATEAFGRSRVNTAHLFSRRKTQFLPWQGLSCWLNRVTTVGYLLIHLWRSWCSWSVQLWLRVKLQLPLTQRLSRCPSSQAAWTGHTEMGTQQKWRVGAVECSEWQ